jgi:hypothetical protein
MSIFSSSGLTTMASTACTDAGQKAKATQKASASAARRSRPPQIRTAFPVVERLNSVTPPSLTATHMRP